LGFGTLQVQRLHTRAGRAADVATESDAQDASDHLRETRHRLY